MSAHILKFLLKHPTPIGGGRLWRKTARAMEVQVTGALSGELLFAGAVNCYAQLLRRLEFQPGFQGFRLLIGSSEVLCDQELQNECIRAQERPVSVIVLHDGQLEQRLLWVLENAWQSPPTTWWDDRAFAHRSCLLRPCLARAACVARGSADTTFLLFAIGQDDWAIRSAGYREPAFYIEAVAANPKAYAHLPHEVRYGNSTRQLAILALRDPDMWRMLPNSYEDGAAYLDVLAAGRTTPHAGRQSYAR